MRVLVTGGAGFIGSNFVHLIARRRPDWRIVNLDALTYAGNLENLQDLQDSPSYEFVHGDICRLEDIQAAFDALGAGSAAIIHFAAESHVDRSILSGAPFVRTNVLGTQALIDVARERGIERFVHVSTDEVYGSLGPDGSFTEESPLRPNSPYSASKAASDLLVRAAIKTHGFPALITRCSNNYGPYQFPEKMIPLMIANAKEDRPLPVYGDGLHVRDWLYVIDHCDAILRVLEGGGVGAVYNIGGHNEYPNIEVVRMVLRELGKPESLIQYVEDRPGHDRRYALDTTRIESELGWKPQCSFEQALRETIRWYDVNGDWLDGVRTGEYRAYYEKQYGGR